MEGARDVQKELGQRGISYCFFLGRKLPSFRNPIACMVVEITGSTIKIPAITFEFLKAGILNISKPYLENLVYE